MVLVESFDLGGRTYDVFFDGSRVRHGRKIPCVGTAVAQQEAYSAGQDRTQTVPELVGLAVKSLENNFLTDGGFDNFFGNSEVVYGASNEMIVSHGDGVLLSSNRIWRAYLEGLSHGGAIVSDKEFDNLRQGKSFIGKSDVPVLSFHELFKTRRDVLPRVYRVLIENAGKYDSGTLGFSSSSLQNNAVFISFTGHPITAGEVLDDMKNKGHNFCSCFHKGGSRFKISTGYLVMFYGNHIGFCGNDDLRREGCFVVERQKAAPESGGLETKV